MEIRAEEFAAARSTGSHIGVDMDSISAEYRANICHLNNEGAEFVSNSWFRILRNFVAIARLGGTLNNSTAKP